MQTEIAADLARAYTAVKYAAERSMSTLGQGQHVSRLVDVPDAEGEDAFDVRVWTNPSDSQIRSKLANLPQRQPLRGVVSGDDLHVWWAEDVHHQPTAHALGDGRAIPFEDRLSISREDDGVVVSSHAPNPRLAEWAKAMGYRYEA